jgi:hypothetical protein
MFYCQFYYLISTTTTPAAATYLIAQSGDEKLAQLMKKSNEWKFRVIF